MSLTPNFGFNIPDSTDIVNLLTQCYPNFTIADTALQAVKETGVTVATESKAGTVHNLVRNSADCALLWFTATSNYTTGDTFTVDGSPVSAVKVSGAGLETGDFVINSNVLAIVKGAVLTVLAGGGSSQVEAQDVDYDNTGSGLTATNVQDAIDEVKGDIPVVPASYAASAITYDNTVSGLTASDVQAAIDELKTLIDQPRYITTGLVPNAGVTIDDGGYYIEGTTCYVNIVVTVSTSIVALGTLVNYFPNASGSTGDKTGVVNNCKIAKTSSSTLLGNINAVSSGTYHFSGTYQIA